MKLFLLFCLSIVIIVVSSGHARSQARDFLTDAEVELVRDAQQIDKRVDVLTHAIDRRFAVLKVDVSASALKKPEADWGPPPTGTRLQLLYDIKRILQKAIDDIDNLSARPDSMVVEEAVDKKKPKSTYSDLFPKAVRALGAAAERYKTPLKQLLDASGGGAEKGSILDALDMCDQIHAALAKLPPTLSSPKKSGN